MALSSSEIKRQILSGAKNSHIRKNISQKLDKGTLTEGEIIEMGNAFESLTTSKGWYYIEAYMLRNMDIIGLVFSESDASHQKGIARGYISLMQYIDQIIKIKNDIIQREQHEQDKPRQSENP